MEKEIKKEYTNGEITVVWKPKICIHAAECVHTLPDVYDPEKNPWITIENASTDALKAQIAKCPSGALSYYMNNAEKKEEVIQETKVEVVENGPLLVFGTLEVKDIKGEVVIKTKKTAFCRCGESNNKPYCDGTHRKTEFRG